MEGKDRNVAEVDFNIIENAKEEIDRLRDNIGGLSRAIESRDSLIEIQVGKIEELQEQIKFLEINTKNMVQERSSFSERISNLMNELTKADTENESLKTRLALLADTRFVPAQMGKSVEAGLKATCERLRRQRNSSRDQFNKARSDIDYLINDCNYLRGVIVQLQAKIAHIAEDRNKLVSQNVKLAKELDELKGANPLDERARQCCHERGMRFLVDELRHSIENCANCERLEQENSELADTIRGMKYDNAVLDKALANFKHVLVNAVNELPGSCLYGDAAVTQVKGCQAKPE